MDSPDEATKRWRGQGFVREEKGVMDSERPDSQMVLVVRELDALHPLLDDPGQGALLGEGGEAEVLP